MKFSKINDILPFYSYLLFIFHPPKSPQPFTPYIRTQRIQQIQALPAEAPHSSTLRIPLFLLNTFQKEKQMEARYSIVFYFLILLCLSSAFAFPSKKQYKPCKHLVLYFHDIIYNGKNAGNATSAIVAAPDGANLTVLAGQFHFGNVVVFDDPITLDNNLHSKPVGRAQGLYIYDTKNTFTSWLGFTFVLNSTDHQGTINFSGADPILVKSRDISIVGGTGDFFMHRGIATIMTDAFEGEVYFRLRVDIKFYECW